MRFGVAEISLPILSPANNIAFAERLILTGAVRYESIDRVGNVATPKFGIILAPASDIAFKFSWGKSFKAPTLYQTGQPRIGYSQNGATDYFPLSPAVGAVLYLSGGNPELRSEEHTSELQSLMRTSYAVFCLKKKNHNHTNRL